MVAILGHCVKLPSLSLIDYTMVSFVKPNLLGTSREFFNRFGNPISNGQHADSRPADVRLMKQRAHILFQLLSGCVDVRMDTMMEKWMYRFMNGWMNGCIDS